MRPPFLIGLPQGGPSRYGCPFQLCVGDGRGVELTGKSYQIRWSHLLMSGIFRCRVFSASSLCRIFSFGADPAVCWEFFLRSSCLSEFQPRWCCCRYPGVSSDTSFPAWRMRKFSCLICVHCFPCLIHVLKTNCGSMTFCCIYSSTFSSYYTFSVVIS